MAKKRFTQEQYQKALEVDLLDFLQKRGHEFKKCSSEYHMKEHDSFVVKGHLWKWWSKGIGGNIVSYLTKVEGMDTVDAVYYLCGQQFDKDREKTEFLRHSKAEENAPKCLIAPYKNETYKHAFAYLMKTRMIDKEIISEMMHSESIYESIEYFARVKENDTTYNPKILLNTTFDRLKDSKLIQNKKQQKDGVRFGYDEDRTLKYIGIEKLDNTHISLLCKCNGIERVSYVNNCVFCGFDEAGEMRFASMRSTNQASSFRYDAIGADKQYGFAMIGKSDTVYAFEAPIDALSHATLYKLEGLDWQRDSRISLSGVSDLALERFLNIHPDIRKIHLCLDNDKAGKESIYGVFDKEKGEYISQGLLKKYEEKGYEVFVDLPVLKDYNKDLIEYCKSNEKMYENDEEAEM